MINILLILNIILTVGLYLKTKKNVTVNNAATPTVNNVATEPKKYDNKIDDIFEEVEYRFDQVLSKSNEKLVGMSLDNTKNILTELRKTFEEKAERYKVNVRELEIDSIDGIEAEIEHLKTKGKTYEDGNRLSELRQKKKRLTTLLENTKSVLNEVYVVNKQLCQMFDKLNVATNNSNVNIDEELSKFNKVLDRINNI